MPSRYPADVRRQVVELARSGTKVAQFAETFGMSEASTYFPSRPCWTTRRPTHNASTASCLPRR